MSYAHIFPVSFAQQRLLFLDQLYPGTSAYNLTRAIRMVGRLDSAALTKTLDKIARRHASLRTRYIVEAGQSYQIVDEEVRLQLPILDISHLPNATRESEAQRLTSEEGQKSFNLTSGPLFRALLLRLGSDDHVFVLVMHHIITDGWSMSILFDEIGKIYSELALAKAASLPTLSVQYLDFARWQREHFTAETLHHHATYWANKLRGHAGTLDLPTDRPRPAVQSYQGAVEAFKIREQLARALTGLAETHGATLFMVLLAAFQTLLWRYTRSTDIVIGTPIAGRNDARFEKLIGCFVNTLVIRGDLSGNPTFLELLRRIRETTLEAYEHQDLPFEQLVESLKPQRSLRYTPLFQVMLVLHNGPKQVLEIQGLTCKEFDFDPGSAKFDLTLEVVEQDGLHCSLEYSTALFEKQSIRRLARHFETLLSELVKSPERPISALDILDEVTRNDLIFKFNATDTPYRRSARIDEIFEEQVERAPDRVALVEGDSQITYRELNAKANALATLLVREGLNQDRPVGIYMQRSIDVVVALLAALKANTPYVPLDILNPSHRLKLLIDDAACEVVLTHRGLRSALPGTVKAISMDDLALISSSPCCSDGDRSSEDLAYIIYTSGSTGVPKGVEGSHRAAINRFEWMWQAYPFCASEICCHKTPLGFVDSVWEIFGPLLGGARAVIVPDELLRDINHFVALLARHEVTRIVMVPSLLRALLDVVPDLAARLPKLTLWSTSGEPLFAELVCRFREALPNATLLNIYGSSEVTADVTYWQLTASESLSSIPIGKPISNAQIFILDQHKNLVPPLVPGEIHVGGDCLARGYWKEPKLTAQRFIPNPYRPDQSPFIFATGDLGRILADGTIEYLGRLDQQIKLRGMRIEPGEIEASLAAHPLVRDAAIAVHGDSSEMRQLIAYIVWSDPARAWTDELRRFLRARVPEYMVPAVFVELQCMPLLPNGKLDRSALPRPNLDSLAKRRNIVRGRTEVEKRLSSIWQEVLELSDVSTDDNFFDLGGDSLGGMRVLARVRRDFHVDVSIRSLFEGPTIAELALEVDRLKAKGANGQTIPIAPVSSSSSALLTVLRAELGAMSPDQLDAILQSVLAETSARADDRN
jgi:amino acid adenylation domain-containing protein